MHAVTIYCLYRNLKAIDAHTCLFFNIFITTVTGNHLKKKFQYLIKMRRKKKLAEISCCFFNIKCMFFFFCIDLYVYVGIL